MMSQTSGTPERNSTSTQKQSRLDPTSAGASQNRKTAPVKCGENPNLAIIDHLGSGGEGGLEHMADADVNNLLYIRNEPPPLPARGRSLHQGCERPGPVTELDCVQLCRDYASPWQASARTLGSERIQMFPQNATFTDNYTVG